MDSRFNVRWALPIGHWTADSYRFLDSRQVSRTGCLVRQSGPYRADMPIGLSGADKTLSAIRWPIGLVGCPMADRSRNIYPTRLLHSLTLALALSLTAAPSAAAARPLRRLLARRCAGKVFCCKLDEFATGITYQQSHMHAVF